MTYKTILVPLGSTESARSILTASLQIARRFGSHLDVLHVRPDPRGLVPYTGEGMDGSMIEEIMEVTEKEGGDRATKTRALFDEFCASENVTVTDTPAPGTEATIAWKEATGREDEVVALRGRLYDLIVLGRSIRDAPLPSPITLEAALLDTGRPIVVAPPEAPASTAEKIAICWEGSPEAARAIADAIPLMVGAKLVTILCPQPPLVQQLDPEHLVARLAWEGVEASVQSFDSSAGDLGKSFLDNARTAGADLLIKGAYSQSRLRQMILGGRTRHILAHTTIPVLLAH